MPPAFLFVYGSLRRNRGGGNHPLLAGATHRGDATVEGTLYRVSWYPGLVLEGNGRVHGELFELPAERAQSMIAALDEYEGGGYRRVASHAQLSSGASVETFLYVYAGPIEGLEVIPSGDFGAPAHRARPDDPTPDEQP